MEEQTAQIQPGFVMANKFPLLCLNLKFGNKVLWPNRGTAPQHPCEKSSLSEFFVFSHLVWQRLGRVPCCFPVAIIDNFLPVLPDYTRGRERWLVWVKLVVLPVSRTRYSKDLWPYNCLIWGGDHCERQKHHEVWSWPNLHFYSIVTIICISKQEMKPCVITWKRGMKESGFVWNNIYK